MTICFLPRNFFAALCLLTMFAFGAGCATHQEQPGTRMQISFIVKR